MNTLFKFALGEKVMASIANPRNAESFGRLVLYSVIGRDMMEDSSGVDISYYLRPVDVRDGTLYPVLQVEQESLRSVAEYNSELEARDKEKKQ